jgi:hypothetical protein
MKPRTEIWGLLAQFEQPQQVLEATKRARQEGYTVMDAFSPYAVEGLADELGLPRTRVPFVVLVAAIVGAGVGFFMQYWTMAVDYPINVGGRPLNSWPVFIPIAFEVMVLVASFSALFGMFFLNGLPRPHYPLFNVPQFARATQDRFFLCIEATDPKFDRVHTAEFLMGLHPVDVAEVPHEESKVPHPA